MYIGLNIRFKTVLFGLIFFFGPLVIFWSSGFLFIWSSGFGPVEDENQFEEKNPSVKLFYFD